MLYTTGHGQGPRSVQGGDGRCAPLEARPKKGRRRPVGAAPQAERPTAARDRAPPPSTMTRPHALQSFDRDVDRALARGRRMPEAKLDLHGMTLAAAERAVAQFLAQS